MTARASTSRRGYLLAKWWTEPSTSDLKRQRLAKNLSLEELASAAGIARATVARAEAGGNVNEDIMWRIAKALGVPREFIDPTYREHLRATQCHWTGCDD